jgi:uncharacterized protein
MKRVLLALLLTPLIIGGVAIAYTSPGAPTGYVSDFAGVLSAEVANKIETELVTFNASTTNEVAVVTVPNLGGDYIENYAVKLFEEWGIGTAKNDNGVLLIIAVEDRELRIEVGYGLEGALPDSVAASIISDMVPYLKDGDYDGAVTLGVTGITQATRGEYVGAGNTGSLDFDTIFSIFFFGIILIQWFIAVLSRSKSYWAGGVIGALAGGIMSSIFGWWLLGGAALTLSLFVIGLLFDYAVSSAYHEAKRTGLHPPWWTGGTGGTGSSSSGGFGGFGGGSSGGGGASGSY